MSKGNLGLAGDASSCEVLSRGQVAEYVRRPELYFPQNLKIFTKSIDNGS